MGRKLPEKTDAAAAENENCVWEAVLFCALYGRKTGNSCFGRTVWEGYTVIKQKVCFITVFSKPQYGQKREKPDLCCIVLGQRTAGKLWMILVFWGFLWYDQEQKLTAPVFWHDRISAGQGKEGDT